MHSSRLVLLLVLLIAAGCVASRARKISAALSQMRASEVRACLGTAPFAEANPDGSETWVYTGSLSERAADITISRNFGPGTAFKRPQVEQGNPVERKSYEAKPSTERIAPGQCLFLFSVENGAVRSFKSLGRTSANLNADVQCAIELDECVDTSPAPSGGAEEP